MSPFSLENEAFASLVKYGSIVLLKMVAMSLVTAYFRITRGALASPEDASMAAGGDKEMEKKMLAKNDDVERARSAHLNDMENIIPFFLISLLYISIGPNPVTAALAFKIFTGSRILHTIAYVGKIRQPVRGLGFFGGLVVNVYMLFAIIRHVW